MLNGVGGHIEGDETPTAAMVREFAEETGIETHPLLWHPLVRLTRGDVWSVHFFYAVSSLCPEDPHAVIRNGPEPVYVFPVIGVLGDCRLVWNLNWLITACMDQDLVKPLPDLRA